MLSHLTTNYCTFSALELRLEFFTLYLMWRSEADLPLPHIIKTHDDPRSPKGIPTDMVLASFPLIVHCFRLLIPRRSCERICAIHAPRTSSPLSLDPQFSHMFFLPSTRLFNSVTSWCVHHLTTLCIADANLRRQISSGLESGYTLPIISRDTTARGGRYVRTLSPLGKR